MTYRNRMSATIFGLLSMCACSNRNALVHARDPSDGAADQAGDDVLIPKTVSDGHFSQDGPPNQSDSRIVPPRFDAAGMDQRVGGIPNLDGGCSADKLWLFPDVSASSFCGDLGDACQFYCETRLGCLVEAPRNSPQLVYCPPDGATPPP